jgi:transposase InsO family protein
MGKQHRHELTTDEDKPSTKKLELVHMDIMGPFRRPTRQGHRYVLTIIDDHSRYTWLFFLHKKSDAFTEFKNWAALVEKEAGCLIQRIRSDNGGEFKNKVMTAFCTDHHYRQEFTNSYTPQQNGCAERFNRTVMEAVRCLLAAANMSSLLKVNG